MRLARRLPFVRRSTLAGERERLKDEIALLNQKLHTERTNFTVALTNVERVSREQIDAVRERMMGS